VDELPTASGRRPPWVDESPTASGRRPPWVDGHPAERFESPTISYPALPCAMRHSHTNDRRIACVSGNPPGDTVYFHTARGSVL
jgi:hypothetical protein